MHLESNNPLKQKDSFLFFLLGIFCFSRSSRTQSTWNFDGNHRNTWRVQQFNIFWNLDVAYPQGLTQIQTRNIDVQLSNHLLRQGFYFYPAQFLEQLKAFPSCAQWPQWRGRSIELLLEAAEFPRFVLALPLPRILRLTGSAPAYRVADALQLDIRCIRPGTN